MGSNGCLGRIIENKKESDDKPDSFFVYTFSPRLHDFEVVSNNTNNKQSNDDNDW